jgi:uncharacterized membrane protein
MVLMLRRACLAASMAWAAMIPLAAFAASRPHGPSLGYAFALGAYAIGHVICHQLPARSFQLWGAVFPVCARCTGIYLGAAIVSALVWTWPRTPMNTSRLSILHKDPAARARQLLLAAIAPTAITLIYEWTTGITPAHWIRALAGLPLGAAVAWLIGTLSVDPEP